MEAVREGPNPSNREGIHLVRLVQLAPFGETNF